MVKDERRILNVTAEDVLAGKLAMLDSTVEDLRAAKHLSKGRQAIGAGIITMAAFHFMNGGLTGNGPTNRQQRNLWMDAGYKPRSIRIGDWVSYDSFNHLVQSYLLLLILVTWDKVWDLNGKNRSMLSWHKL